MIISISLTITLILIILSNRLNMFWKNTCIFEIHIDDNIKYNIILVLNTKKTEETE